MVNSAVDCCLRGEDLGAFPHDAAERRQTAEAYVPQLKRHILFLCIFVDRDLEPIAFIHGTVLVRKKKCTRIRKVNLFLVSFLSLLSAFKIWDFFVSYVLVFIKAVELCVV